MHTRLVRGRDEVLLNLHLARELVDGPGQPVCARSLWLSTWIETTPSIYPLAVVVEGETGSTEGLAVLAARRSAGRTWVTLAGHGVVDQARIPARTSEAAQALASGVLMALRSLRGRWRADLEQLPPGDPVAKALAGSYGTSHMGDGVASPLTMFSEPRTLSAHLSKNGRKIAKQGTNRLNRDAAEWHVDRVSSTEDVERVLPVVVELRRNRDHVLGRPSDLDHDEGRAFFEAAVRRLSAQGELEVWTLVADGAVVAYLITIRDGVFVRLWDGRIAAGAEHLRAGRVLDSRVLTAALETPGVEGLDWMRGVLDHKLQSSNALVETENLTLWSDWMLRRTDLAVRSARARVRDAMSEETRLRARRTIRQVGRLGRRA